MIRKKMKIMPMTPEEFAAKMQAIYDKYCRPRENPRYPGDIMCDDEEMVHIVMDDAMCELLRELGYGKAVDIFNQTPKWYA